MPLQFVLVTLYGPHQVGSNIVVLKIGTLVIINIGDSFVFGRNIAIVNPLQNKVCRIRLMPYVSICFFIL